VGNPFFRSNARVELVAPGFRCDELELSSGKQILKEWGLGLSSPSPLFGHDILCSNSLDLRLNFLKKALSSSESEAIWCVRGGYGSLQLLEGLDKMKVIPDFKLIIGYSDITSLHSFVRQKWGWPSLHGPLVDGLGAQKPNLESQKALHDFLWTDNSEISFKGLKPMNSQANESRVVKSEVVGGNLSVLQSTLGTSFQEDISGKILFLEDVGERGYRIDKMLTHMKLSGYLKGVEALVLGDFTGGLESDGSSLVFEVLKKWALELNFPVLSGLPCGHGQQQYPLALGTEASLFLGQSSELRVKGFAKWRK